MKKKWSVYMVRCEDSSLYTGVSSEVTKRVMEHNLGKGAKYTRSRRPVVLVYQEKAIDRSTAQKREAEIKRMKRTEKLKLL